MNRQPLVLLDTHTWLWWLDQPNRLSAVAERVIRSSQAIGLSVISCWEVAQLVALGRLQLKVSVDEWLTTTLAIPRVELLDMTPEIAVNSWSLPGALHRDPADRILVATARDGGWPIVTRDQAIRNYPHVETIW